MGLLVTEKKIFLKISHYKSKRVIDPHGCDKFAPKRLDWQDLCRVPLDIAIHTKYISCGPHGFREDFFMGGGGGGVSITSLWESLIHMAWPVWTPGA